MNANDTLLQQIIVLDEINKGNKIISIQDALIQNPKEIRIGANEIVYVYFFSSNYPVFNIQLITASKVVNYNNNTTLSNTNNQIIRCLGDVKFIFNENENFYVQYVKINY